MNEVATVAGCSHSCPESGFSCYPDSMRYMEISPFPDRPIDLTDLGSFIKQRVIDEVVELPEQALALVSYMAWPNDVAARGRWLDANRAVSDQSEINELSRKLKLIQQHWARVADIVHHHFDFDRGQHQKTRGGASVGKAIALIDAIAKSKGTGAAKLWDIWKSYKDVAHLITATVLISGEATARHRKAPYQAKLHQFQPYRMAMLLPELVISVAMSIESYGLQYVAKGGTAPMFDPETLWRVPVDINLSPIELPTRKITKADIAVLNARRAGNRGKANQRKTTPVFG